MTLADIKKKTLSLIEELNPVSQYLTDDTDIQAKINYVVNQIQYEASRMKKIADVTTIETTAGETESLKDIITGFYQLIKITGVDYEIIEDLVTWNETGTATVFYYKYPTEITGSTADTYTMELDPDVLEIIPYGIAADLLKSDPSSQYGGVYASRYSEMMSRLDPRQSTGMITFEGGI